MEFEKKYYDCPKAEIELFNVQDQITTSNNSQDPYDDPDEF